MIELICFVAGVLVGHVVLHPLRRKKLMGAIDLGGIKGSPEQGETSDGNRADESRRSG